MSSITDHEGSKYIRNIHSAVNDQFISIDVAAQPRAEQLLDCLLSCRTGHFEGDQYRIKGSEAEDLQGALAAVNRAIELQANEEVHAGKTP